MWGKSPTYQVSRNKKFTRLLSLLITYSAHYSGRFVTFGQSFYFDPGFNCEILSTNGKRITTKTIKLQDNCAVNKN